MDVYTMIQALYNQFLRPHLPTVVGTKSGVLVRDFKLLDLTREEPDYKRGMVQAVREHAAQARVVEVGTGRGILTCHAVQAGAKSVESHEAADEMLSLARDTLSRNLGDDWSTKVHLHHASVGETKVPYGSPAGAQTVDPSELDGDVLILDVEGAESTILPSVYGPAVIICETHPEHGVSEADVRAVLEDHGYEVSRRPYEPDQPEKSVLVGRKPDANW